MGEVKNFRFKTTKGDVNIPVKDIIARERIGDLEQLQTPHKDNLVNAINDLEGGSGGTTDYNNLDNKPSINGVTLVGNKTTEDLGIEGVTDYDELENKPSINGKELEGNLSTEDLEIEYDDILNRPVESGDVDIDAVVDPLPTVVSKSNVVFDERGTEYEDGIYIKEIDGTAMYKTVYQKSIVGTANLPQMPNYSSIGTTSALISSDIDNIIDVLITGKGTGTGYQGFQSPASYVAYVNIGGDVNVGQGIASGTTEIEYRITTKYTKTTDTWQEYVEDTQ